MKKTLILLLALPLQGYATPPGVLEQLNKTASWKTDQWVNDAVRDHEKAAMCDVVTGLDVLPVGIKKLIIDPLRPFDHTLACSSGSFLGKQFERERRDPVTFRNRLCPSNRNMALLLGCSLTLFLVGGSARDAAKIVNRIKGVPDGPVVTNCDRMTLLGWLPWSCAAIPVFYPEGLKAIRENHPLCRHLTQVHDIFVSEDGNYFVTFSDDKSLLWNSKTNKCLGIFSWDLPEAEQRFELITSPEGYHDLCVIAGKAVLHDKHYETVQVLEAPDTDITAATYTNDGKNIIVGTQTGGILTYRQKKHLAEAFDGKPTKRERRRKQLKWSLAAAGTLAGASYVGSYLWNKNSK